MGGDTRLRNALRSPSVAVIIVSLAATLGVALLSPWGVGRASAAGGIVISEVAPWSSGNSPAALAADWFEVTNTTGAAVNVTGWKVDDGSAAFATAFPLTGVTSIAAGESVIFIEIAVGAVPPNDLAGKAAAFRTVWFGGSPPVGLQIGGYSGAGLGLSTGGDGVTLFDTGGAVRAAVAFGTSPGAAPFRTFLNAAGLEGVISAVSVAGQGGAFAAANDATEVGSPGNLGTQPLTSTVKINEVESNGGVPGDWVELINTGAAAADLSGYLFRDSSNANTYTLPAGSTIAVGGYLVLEQAQFVFGLDSIDSARLLSPSGAAVLDSRAWLEHSSTTYGRCANGTGIFYSTLAPTKGTANSCPTYAPWPGDPAVQTADGADVFGENMSGLIYEPSGTATPGVLWAVRNNPETLFRLVWDAPNQRWTPDTAGGWGGGKQLRYTSGAGRPDSEGVTFTDAGPSGGMYVSTERDNGVSGTSRPAVLRFDPSAPGAELTATDEWILTGNLPALGANLGLEAITWVPDAFLVARGFLDESTNAKYNPATYPGHGAGLFFVGVEASGFIYGYALTPGGGFTRVATIDSGFPGVMELQFDRQLQDFWAACDDTCSGRTHQLRVDPTTGKFGIGERFERPVGMPNLNNEGFAMASQAECVNNRKPVFWTDDGQTGTHAVRRGTVSCAVTSTGPLTTEDCKGGGWQPFNFPARFKNQGDCVSYVATKGKNGP